MMAHRLHIVFVLTLLCGAMPALAQVRTWVSVHGSDLNDCSRSSPCRNFEAAIAAVAAGGEVVVLDSGGFGPVTINKGVTLLAPEGIHAAIAPTSGTAVRVTSATGPVFLSNLYLNSQGAVRGIGYLGSSDLSIRTTVASGFIDEGLFASGGGDLTVTDSEFRNNDLGFVSIMETPARAMIDGCRFEGNSASGLGAWGNASFVIRNSVASENGSGFEFNWGRGQQATLVHCVAASNTSSGIFLTNSSPTPTTLTVHLERCSVSGNGTGLFAMEAGSGEAALYVAGSTIVHNGQGISASPDALVSSRGNNTLENNGSNNFFPNAPFPPK